MAIRLKDQVNLSTGLKNGESVLGEHAVHGGYYGLWNTEAISGTTQQYLIISAGTDTYINGDNVYIRAGNNSTTNQLKVTTSGTTIGGNTVWHAGNDGASSGLDADLLDGVQGASYLRSDTSDTFTGTLTLNGQLDLSSTDTATNYIHLPRGGGITFYGDTSQHHGIFSRNNVNGSSDDILISSYNRIFFDLDSNNNNTNTEFSIGTHNGSTKIFNFSGETAHLTIGADNMTPMLDLMFDDHASGAGWDTRIQIGKSDDLAAGTGVFPTYVPAGAYGMQVQANSDGVFFGMEEYSSGNYRPIIQWGDDNSDTPFRIKHENGSELEVSYNGIVTATTRFSAPTLYSTVAIGTSPLTVTSTTLVSNLNADLLDGYHASTTRNSANTIPIRDANGYLQLGWINTTSGATTATINKIYVSDDNYIRYITPATFISQLGLWTSGNDGASSGLDADTVDGIQAASFLRSDANDTASGQYSFTKTNDHAIKVGTIRGTAVGSQSGEYIHMYERVHIGGPSGWGASNAAAPSYGLSTYGGANLATNTGNVGIGTTSPGKKLEIHTNTNTDGIRVQGSATNLSLILNQTGTGGQAWDISSIGGGHGHGNGKLMFNVGFSAVPTVSMLHGSTAADKKVGIGTHTPAANLQVVGSGSAVFDIQGSQGQLFSVTDDLTGDIFSVSDVSGVPILNVNSNGTSSFDGDLDVTQNLNVGDGSSQSVIKIKKADNDVSDHIQFYNGTTRVGEIGVQDDSWLRINETTAKNIYTPRYFRADGGLHVNSTSYGINGSGRLLDASFSGTYSNSITFSGGLVASGGISGLTLANGISGTNFNITGVNQLEIADPGEGIVFKSGASGDMTLAIVDDSTDNILRFSGTGAQLQVGTNRVLTTADEGPGNGLDADTLDGSGWEDYGRNIHANQIIVDDWLRTTGNTGWYSNTHGGGWYMTDSSWIRSYNNKSIYQNTGTLRTDGTFQVGASGATFQAISGGAVTINGNTAWHAGNDGPSSGLDADTVDGIQGASLLRSDAQDAYTPKRIDFGASSGWDAVGFGNITNLHVQGHNQFWFGAGNGTWFTGTANTKTSTAGLAGDASAAHDLLISTMQGTSTYDRGITFAVDSGGAGNAGWRLGKWHSSNSQASSKLTIDGGLHVRGGDMLNYDYYADDYSVYWDNQAGGAYWTGDTGWIDPSITAGNAIQIQAGNAAQNPNNPALQFHQYGYGGVQLRYDGPNNVMHLESTAAGRMNYFQNTTDHGYIQLGPMNTGHAHIYTDRSNFYFNKEIRVLGGSTITQTTVTAATGTFTNLSSTNNITGRVNGLADRGFGDTELSFYQDSGAFGSQWSSGWASHIVCNHGNGSNYYNQIIHMPFWGPPQYSRMEGNTSTIRGRYDFCTSEASFTTAYTIQAGTLRATADVVAYYSSDERLKDNIIPIGNAIDKIKQIGGYEFDWNDKQKNFEGHDYGVIAQEVEKVLPELVKDREDGYKGVRYEKLTSVLIQGIKEQQDTIENQQKQIDELKDLVNKLINK